MAHDIIGDIHGQAEKLVALLKTLGYRHTHGAWRHPSKTALFVGDFVDRGPGQIETLDIVRRMIDAGSAEAVMGNHEFNAIAWHTPDPINDGKHLRKRTDKNRGQHQSFLAQVGENSAHHDEWVNWFMGLPLWLDKPGLRVVHACWHAGHIAALAPLLGPNNTLTPDLVEQGSRKGHAVYEAVEAICKGMEIELPHPVSFQDSQGITRTTTRTKWWDETADTYQSAALLGAAETAQLPLTIIPDKSRVVYDQLKPVFFGHYWLTGAPSILNPKACCVDYSAARDGHPLVAYRWDGEQELTNENMVAVLPGVVLGKSKRL